MTGEERQRPLAPPAGTAEAAAVELKHHSWAEHQRANRDNFNRFFRFGLVDSSLLLVSILAGFSLDAVIAKRIGARGYGPVVGAGIGNLVADTVAGMPEGRWAAGGVMAGAALPLVPLAAIMATRKPLEGRPAHFLSGFCGLLFAGTFIYGYVRPDDCDDTEKK